MDSVVIPVTSESDRPVRIADPAHFTGKAIVAPLFPAEAPSEATAAYVTFEPGARTDWHSHPVGQHLAVTRGSGYIQFWGGERKKIGQGDVVWIPPGIKHWHGATPDNSFTHLAVQEHWQVKPQTGWKKLPMNNTVCRSSYQHRQHSLPAHSKSTGETAPKLAELTDQVLYNDIWERPSSQNGNAA